MTKIDYMKVIDVLARTLKMEGIEVTYPGKSNNKKGELSLTGSDKTRIKFKLTLQDYHLELTLLKKYFTDREFEKWASEFEYELEQTFFDNISIHVDTDVSNYIIRVEF